MAWPLQKRPASRRARILRLLACVALGLLVTVPLYVGLAKSGVIRSPFFPRADGDLALARSDRAGLRVLFVGNSFTYYNEMPSMVHRLAESDPGAPPLFVVEYTAPNWSLKEASTNGGLEELVGDVPWDFVVLQDVSWALSYPSFRERETYPAARILNREIQVARAKTVLFLTWGYKNGDPTWPGDSFDAMQARLTEGYEELAGELRAEVAPVGPAWAEAVRRRPGLDLWKRGGGHPNRLGSYLAACVFYGTLTGQDPSRSTFTGGLDPADAHFLQEVAADVVAGMHATA
jgi:hypothetical protein